MSIGLGPLLAVKVEMFLGSNTVWERFKLFLDEQLEKLRVPKVPEPDDTDLGFEHVV